MNIAETQEDNFEEKTKIKNGGAVMKKSLFASILMVLIGGCFASSVIADDTLVRFKGAIGDIPVANVAGTPNPDGSFPDVIRNIVRGVNPAGQIWVISDFRADVKVDGRIRVDGRGLLLGGGNAIGTNGNASVFATLICEAAAPFTQFSTNITGVPLAANGDFRIDDVLMPGATGRVRQPRAPYPRDAQRSLVCCGHPEAGLAPMEHEAKCGDFNTFTALIYAGV